jgi:two-component system chemotaxis sensor kinase CheA
METLLEGRSKNLAPRRCILICRQGTSRIGLLVGAVREQQPVVIRSLNSNIQGAFGVLGGTILGNGEPGLILDLKSLLGKIFKDVDKQERAA